MGAADDIETPVHTPLNITFRVGAFPKLSETFVLSQVAGMIARGHRVSILADRRPASNEAGVMPEGLASVDYLEPASSSFAALIARLPYRVRRSRIARAERRMCGSTDVVICNFGWFGAQVVESTASIARRAKVVTIFHGDDMSRSLRGAPGDVYDQLFALGDLHLPISELWKSRLIEMGAPADRVQVHRMGVQVDDFAYQPRTPSPSQAFKLVTVCRIVEKKGVEYALTALAALKGAAPDLALELDIIGNGPLREHMEQLASTLQIEDRVRFLGQLPNVEVAERLRNADAFLLPSVVAADGDMEGIPVALMEAMASGLPVISTRHSGIPELIEHGVSGVLADERDVDGLAEQIRFVAETPHARSQMAKTARKVVEERFNTERLNDRLDAVVRELVSEAAVATHQTPKTQVS